MPQMVKALMVELEMRNTYLPNNNISTIYFGGGTPSVLSVTDLQKLIDLIRKLYRVDSDAEITFEANPDDLSKENVLEWKAAGINRLSIGVQSFHSKDLQWMNRNHNSVQALKSIKTAQECGIDNINIDLIYALPTLSDEDWVKNIQIAISTGIKHLSCYCLTVEEKTKLNHLIKTSQTPAIDEEQSTRQFSILMDKMYQEDFEHYEISNFAKPGFRSKHNSGYWKRKPYIGIGPSAHSFDGTSRQWNISSNAAYLKAISTNTIDIEREKLSTNDHFNETIMTSLRTIDGVNLDNIKQAFGDTIHHNLANQSTQLIRNGLLEKVENCLKLTREGKFLADDIASQLFRL